MRLYPTFANTYALDVTTSLTYFVEQVDEIKAEMDSIVDSIIDKGAKK